MITNRELTEAYAEMVTDRVTAGFKPYFLTFMFADIKGSPHAVQDAMRREIERVYATMLTRIVRHPRSEWHGWKVPALIACFDWPVPKHDRLPKRLILPNDGQHIHAIELMPPLSRMKEPLDEHVRAEQGRYIREPLVQIDAVPITDNVSNVMDYLFKAMMRGRVTADDLIVLPRASSELATSSPRAA